MSDTTQSYNNLARRNQAGGINFARQPKKE